MTDTSANALPQQTPVERDYRLVVSFIGQATPASIKSFASGLCVTLQSVRYIPYRAPSILAVRGIIPGNVNRTTLTVLHNRLGDGIELIASNPRPAHFSIFPPVDNNIQSGIEVPDGNQPEVEGAAWRPVHLAW